MQAKQYEEDKKKAALVTSHTAVVQMDFSAFVRTKSSQHTGTKDRSFYTHLFCGSKMK